MDLFDLSVEDVVKGYAVVEGEYRCAFCDATFTEDVVYPIEGQFLTAKGMMKHHMAAQHRSPFHQLLTLDKKVLGLSDVQIEMLQYFYEGLTDKDIVNESHVTSVSTVRQHRFKLREKERQAKLFLALMQLVKQPVNYAIHKGAKQVDERYSVEAAEREKVLKTYFHQGLDGEMTTIPSKEKKKLIVLQHIVQRFEQEKTYTEKEVNAILKTAHADFVSLRRHLIEYGFMKRNDEGSAYERTM